MKYEITHILCSKVTTNVRIIEAKSPITAVKKMAGEYMNVGKTKKHLSEFGKVVDVYTVGRKGDLPFERDLYIVTPVTEVTETVEVATETVEVAEVVEVASEVASADYITEGNIDAVMMTYSNERLMEIVTTHSLRSTYYDRLLTETATRELAGR